MAARDLPSWALLFSVLMTGGATAQGMAYTMPRGTEPSHTVEPSAQRPWALTTHGAIRDPSGRLPNQAIGPKRDRVVHDICIGC